MKGAGALFWAVLSFCQFRNKTLSQKIEDDTIGWIGKVTLGIKTKHQKALLGYRIWSPDEIDDSNKKYKLSSQYHMIFEIGELECPLTLNQICLLYYLVSEYDTINWNSPTIKIDQDHLHVYHEHMTSQEKRILEMIQKKIPDTIQMEVEKQKTQTNTTQTHLVSNYVDSTPSNNTVKPPKREISLSSLKGRKLDNNKPKISLDDLQEDQKLQRRLPTESVQNTVKEKESLDSPINSTPTNSENTEISELDTNESETQESEAVESDTQESEIQESEAEESDTQESDSIDYGEGEDTKSSDNSQIDSTENNVESISNANTPEMSDTSDTVENSQTETSCESEESNNDEQSVTSDDKDETSSESEDVVPRRPTGVSVNKKSHPYIKLSDDCEVIPKKPAPSGRKSKKKDENVYKSNTRIMSKNPHRNV